MLALPANVAQVIQAQQYAGGVELQAKESADLLTGGRRQTGDRYLRALETRARRLLK
jgi:hypothetical protein